jgi:hypothetical protein
MFRVHSSAQLAVPMPLCRPCLPVTQYRVATGASFVPFVAYFTSDIVSAVTPQLAVITEKNKQVSRPFSLLCVTTYRRSRTKTRPWNSAICAEHWNELQSLLLSGWYL